MSGDVVAYGLPELGAKIDKLFKDTAQKVIRKGSNAGGEVYRKGARRRAPVRKEPGPKGKEGRLPGYGKRHIRRSTRKNPDGSLSTFIGADKKAFYLNFRELGTSHESAEPWLRPTFDNDTGAAEAAFVDAAKAEIAKELP